VRGGAGFLGGWRSGSGDCPIRPLVWRYTEVDSELRAWGYPKPQSPFSSS